jgi:hypothetical protein
MCKRCKSCLFPSSNSQIYRTVQSSPSSPLNHRRPGSSDLEHTIRPTSTREQDILCKFRPQLSKPRLRCRLFLRRLSSFNLCFTLCLRSSKCHSLSLLESKSFKSFLLSCLSSCFFRRCDTVYQLSDIKEGMRGTYAFFSSFNCFLLLVPVDPLPPVSVLLKLLRLTEEAR